MFQLDWFWFPHKRKGTVDAYFSPNQGTQKKGKIPIRQTTIDETLSQKKVEYANDCIIRFFFQNGIAFNVARSDSYKKMVEAIGSCPGMKPPSYHELRVPLLKKEVDRTNDLLKGHREEWAKSGCSVMADGWTDRRGGSLVNFLVNSPKGVVFIESINTTLIKKSSLAIAQLFSNVIDNVIGASNLVQVITDNVANYKAAGEALEGKYKHLFWTPCVAHCMDLILEDIGVLS